MVFECHRLICLSAGKPLQLLAKPRSMVYLSIECNSQSILDRIARGGEPRV